MWDACQAAMSTPGLTWLFLLRLCWCWWWHSSLAWSWPCFPIPHGMYLWCLPHPHPSWTQANLLILTCTDSLSAQAGLIIRNLSVPCVSWNLFLEMFIIKHSVLELLKTMLSKESPNLVNNFKASRYFLQTWICWKHSKNFITSMATWCNCVISNPSDAVGEI